MGKKVWIVRNSDGSRKVFTQKPTLMTHAEIGGISDSKHPHSNVPLYCDPIWVYHNPDKNTLSCGETITRSVISSFGIDYSKMRTDRIYEVNILQLKVTETI